LAIKGNTNVSWYGKLVCLSGPNAGTEYRLSKDVTTIGRSAESDILLEDQFASRLHAEVHSVENAYQVSDLNSKNGVVVSGHRLSPGASVWLEDGCEVQFASTLFRFHDPSATVTAPSIVAVREPGLRVEYATRQVYVDGSLIDPPLSAKQFDLLWYLYQNRGRAVSKDEIAMAVWPEAGGDIYDANIDRMISRLRSRIEPDTSDEQRFVTTVRGYGFRLFTE
jgi:pSer/pThr/pTyr-binding forkhead associated (FHA) protein